MLACIVDFANANRLACTAWDIPVTNLSTLTYEKISGVRGVLFSTYSSLIAKSRPSAKSKKKVMESRLEQVIDWLGGEDFDGLIVFDESHKAKNLVSGLGL